MIIAIDRQSFLYLYKYNNAKIGLHNVYDTTLDQLKSADTNKVAAELDDILPIFEDDHELLILEVEKFKLKPSHILIQFSDVKKVLPLTRIGRELLIGKLNSKISLETPDLEKSIEVLRTERILENKRRAAIKLLNIYGFKPDTEKINKLNQMYRHLLKEKMPQSDKESFIYTLLSYNKTPNFIPSGSAEALAKVGLVAYLALGRSEDKFRDSPYYKLVSDRKSSLRNINILDTVDSFINSLNNDQLRTVDELKKVLSGWLSENMFDCAFYFLAFRIYLNKNEKNLVLIKNDLQNLVLRDPDIAEEVLCLLGFVFSYEQLYESLYQLSQDKNLMRSSGFSNPTVKSGSDKSVSDVLKHGDKIESLNNPQVELQDTFKKVDSFTESSGNPNNDSSAFDDKNANAKETDLETLAEVGTKSDDNTKTITTSVNPDSVHNVLSETNYSDRKVHKPETAQISLDEGHSAIVTQIEFVDPSEKNAEFEGIADSNVLSDSINDQKNDSNASNKLDIVQDNLIEKNISEVGGNVTPVIHETVEVVSGKLGNKDVSDDNHKSYDSTDLQDNEQTDNLQSDVIMDRLITKATLQKIIADIIKVKQLRSKWLTFIDSIFIGHKQLPWEEIERKLNNSDNKKLSYEKYKEELIFKIKQLGKE